MDEDTAQTQIDLVQEAYDTLVKSRATLEHLAEGQTTSLWTADGKSVDLATELSTRYQSAIKWLDSIQLELNTAFVNLDKAIQETNQLDADQKASYQNLLHKAVGRSNKSIAV
ncbi:hypothetical protein [Microbacterium sp. W4I20]|uniref:hypothetical protein n=1 Tax=Microbacterium sp. W4I20 TaxID=3042262 RepID=UPI0027D85F44|nr:hypothetical protein [Microbacterium sp. W4I20]